MKNLHSFVQINNIHILEKLEAEKKVVIQLSQKFINHKSSKACAPARARSREKKKEKRKMGNQMVWANFWVRIFGLKKLAIWCMRHFHWPDVKRQLF